MVRILFYRGKCIGCNGCVEAAPERWRVSKRDGRCSLIEGKEKKGIYKAVVSMDEYDRNLQAANNCPVNIIKVELVN
jgi:ferredoxin